jgi:cysteinyl-tRNA synthetase
MDAIRMTRRMALTGFVLLAGFGRAEAALRPLPPARRKSRDALAQVRAWGCQYQNVEPGVIAASDLDLIVIDPSLNDDSGLFVTRETCRSMQRRPDGSRRIVLGYLCVGEVDTKRWYWPAAWRRNAPDWVGPENPAWPGSRSVQYWNDEWQELVFARDGSMLDRIMDAGFDGVFLDRVDGYGDWGTKPATLDAMAALVVGIAQRARRRDPGFIVMMQNAEHILRHVNLVDAIDAHSKESLLTGLSGPESRNKEQDIDWSLGYLGPLQKQGIPTFDTEYVVTPALQDWAQARLAELGFKPFFGTRGLDHLPGSGTALD